MSKHKALELADWLDECEPNFYGESSSRMDDKLASAVADLTDAARAQHALIVQMREALKVLMVNSSLSAHQIEIIGSPLAAADQYLGEKS